MKKYLILFALILPFLCSAQTFGTTDDFDLILGEACGVEKKILIEFYNDGETLDISKKNLDFVQQFFSTYSCPKNGEVAKIFRVKDRLNYYFLDRDGYRLIASSGANVPRNAANYAGNPSDCKLNDIRKNTDIFTAMSTESNGKTTKVIKQERTDDYDWEETKQVYLDTGEVDVTEELGDSILATFSVKMESEESKVTPKDIYTVQVDIFSTLKAANERILQLKNNPAIEHQLFVNKSVIDELEGKVFYRVSSGKFSDIAECEAYQRNLFRKLKPNAKPGSRDWNDALVKKIDTNQIINLLNVEEPTHTFPY